MTGIDQNRIARNTALLYIRMGVMLLVNLYTSRVILDALGEIDTGIYNAVGGIVMMFSFLSGTMSAACQRFFADEIGKNRYEELKNVFSLCVIVFIAIALLIVILSETVGLWFLYNKAKTAGRLDAAEWVFQLSVISFVFTIIRYPYQGIIIIKEKMKVFTYLSITEVLLNLGIAILIRHYHNDRLVMFSVLMLVVNILITLYYFIYCNAFYKECRFSFWWNREKFLEIFGFAGWNMIGSLSSICKSQGINMLLNVFFGPAVNAARYMAWKVFMSVQQFADNFYTAVKPQIFKSYSRGDREGMLKLVIQSSRLSFYLLFLVSLPIILETQTILDIWLKEVPDYTALFTKLVIINALIEVLVNPLSVSMQAYGDIRKYQIVIGSITLTILPISYLLLKFLHCPPGSVFYTSIIVSLIAVAARLVFVRNRLGLSLSEYIRRTVIPIISVTVVSTGLSILAKLYILSFTWQNDIIPSLITVTISVVLVILTSYTIGMTTSERRNVWKMAIGIIKGEATQTEDQRL